MRTAASYICTLEQFVPDVFPDGPVVVAGPVLRPDRALDEPFRIVRVGEAYEAGQRTRLPPSPVAGHDALVDEAFPGSRRRRSRT